MTGPSTNNVLHDTSPWRAGFQRVYAVLDKTLSHAVVWLIVLSAAISVLQVFFRYVLNNSLPWTEEAAQWAFGWAVFLGMGLLTGRDGHISIKLAGNRLSDGLAQGHVFVVRMIVAATSVMMIINGSDFVSRVMQVSPALEWPMKWLFVAVPVGGALNLIFLLKPDQGRWIASLLQVLAGAVLYTLIVRFAPGVLSADSSATILIIVGLALIFLEVPIAFAMAFGAFVAFAPKGGIMLVVVTQHMSASLNSFTLLAIPFFIAAAAIMNAGGISARLVDLATQLVGHFRGGLGQANVVTNVMLAGVSGSSTADASAIAKLMVPQMEKQGYSRAFSCALTSASSTLANLIPPGLGLIIYAALASVSVGSLFIATIVPGLLAAFALIITVYLVSRRLGYGAGQQRATGAERMQAFGYAVPALMLPVVIVGGVRFGVFTATEAGSIAFVFAILCGAFIYRQLTAESFLEAMREASFDTVAVSIVIAAAAPFAWVLAFEQMPQTIAQSINAVSENKIVLLVLINLFLIVVGLFIEMIAAMVILVPILVPIVIAAGVDPVHFGIVLVLNLVIGALTPPLGVLVYTTARVGKADPVKVFVAIIPFIAAMLAVLFIVTYFPDVSLALLHLLKP